MDKARYLLSGETSGAKYCLPVSLRLNRDIPVDVFHAVIEPESTRKKSKLWSWLYHLIIRGRKGVPYETLPSQVSNFCPLATSQIVTVPSGENIASFCSFCEAIIQGAT